MAITNVRIFCPNACCAASTTAARPGSDGLLSPQIPGSPSVTSTMTFGDVDGSAARPASSPTPPSSARPTTVRSAGPVGVSSSTMAGRSSASIAAALLSANESPANFLPLKRGQTMSVAGGGGRSELSPSLGFESVAEYSSTPSSASPWSCLTMPPGIEAGPISTSLSTLQRQSGTQLLLLPLGNLLNCMLDDWSRRKRTFGSTVVSVTLVSAQMASVVASPASPAPPPSPPNEPGSVSPQRPRREHAAPLHTEPGAQSAVHRLPAPQ
jgi:hypothetical protein